MKAVIMAGGEGTRLRPLTCNQPKPMVRILDRPVMEHIVNLLKSQGITEIAATLAYLPRAITDYFGDGSDFGVNLRYFIEKTPMGTAGSVGACADFLSDGDFLVISGDAVCDIDLSEAVAFHKSKHAEVTVVTHRQKNPREYGIVLTGKDGRITGFVEKPGWEQVFSDRVNTGIYIISPNVLKDIPQNTNYDFSKDLFPKLLENGAGMYGFEAMGYWCDMGDCDAYLKCNLDALSGRVKLYSPLPEVGDGVFGYAENLSGVEISPPVFLGKDVTISKGVRLGPGAIIGSGGSVEPSAKIENSIVFGNVGSAASLFGSITDIGSTVGSGSLLREGSVIGEGAKIGQNVIVSSGVRVWPDISVKNDARLTETITSGVQKTVKVQEDGSLTGELEGTLRPEFCVHLGFVCAAIAGEGSVALADNGATAAKAIASAIAAGVTSAGTQVILLDSQNYACNVYCASAFGAGLSIFVEQSGRQIKIRVAGADGLDLPKDTRRKLEIALSRGETRRVSAMLAGLQEQVYGMASIYTAAAAAQGKAFGFGVNVFGSDSASELLRSSLVRSGCDVDNHLGGCVSFEVSPDGQRLFATDENGRRYDHTHTLMLCARAALLDGIKTLALPYGAPMAFEVLAAEHGGKILRLLRDGADAYDLYKNQYFMRDACFCAVKLCGVLAKKKLRLKDISENLPEFSTVSRELACIGGRGKLMRELTESLSEMSRELVEGLKVCVDGGWAHISPCGTHSGLRIIAEASNEEIAKELCAKFTRRAGELDKLGVDG